MKAHLIDPEKREVTTVEYNGDFTQIQQLLGIDTFDCVRIDRNDTLFIDDNGLLKDPEFFFMLEGYAQPLAGRGLVLGIDAEGESIAPTVTLEVLRAKVKFLRLRVHGFVDTSRGEIIDPVLGRLVEISHAAVFSERE